MYVNMSAASSSATSLFGDSASASASAASPHIASGPPTPSSKSSLKKDALLALVTLQLFDGSWDPEAPELFELILSAALKGTTQGGYQELANRHAK